MQGRVQGVGFRYFVRQAARESGLCGRVANAADGSVVVEAAGPEEGLDLLAARLAEGPPAARVHAVAEEWRGADPGWTRFEIGYGD